MFPRKLFLVLFLGLMALFKALAQPQDARQYLLLYVLPSLEETEKALEKDPKNYALIWESLENKVKVLSLCDSVVISSEVSPFFEQKFDIKKIDLGKKIFLKISPQDYQFFENEFDKIQKNVNFDSVDFVEKGDFYLTKISFYQKFDNQEKIIQNATLLKDSASYSKFYERGKYYHLFALNTLINLHFENKNYEKSLTFTEEKMAYYKEFPRVMDFLDEQNCVLDKVKILEKLDKKDDIIECLHRASVANFDYYFQKNDSIRKNQWQLEIYHIESVKSQGRLFLTEIVKYLKKYGRDASKYEKIIEKIGQWEIDDKVLWEAIQNL